MAAQLLCRHQPFSVLGASENAAISELIVTVQADGVICYDESTKSAVRKWPRPPFRSRLPITDLVPSTLMQERKHSYPLSTSSALRFQTPCVLDESCNTMHVALSQTSAAASSPSSCFLVSHTLGTVSATTPGFRTWADVTPRILLPSTPHSLHMLELSTGSSMLLTAAFLDGSLSALLPGSLSLTPLIPASSTSTLLTATSHQNMICTLHKTAAQANGSSGTSPTGSSSATAILRVHSTTSQGGVHLRHTVHIHAPSPECQLQGSLSMCAAYALVQWTGGWVSVVHNLQLASSSASLPVKHFQVQQPAAVSPSSDNAQAAATMTPSKAANSMTKKRKDGSAAVSTPQLPAGSLPMFVCCAVDASQLFVLDLSTPTSTSTGSHYSLVDTQFGCPIGSGELPSVSQILQAPHPPSNATIGAGSSCSITLQQRGSTADRAQMLLQLHGSVLQLNLPIGRADLMSMIGRLSTTTLHTSSVKSKSVSTARDCFLQVDLLPVLTACATTPTTHTTASESESPSQSDGSDVLLAVQAGLLTASLPPHNAVELLNLMRQTPLPPQPAQLLDQVLLLFTRQHNNPPAAATMSPALTTQLLTAFVCTAAEIDAWPQLSSLIKLLRAENGSAAALRLRLPTCPGLLPALASAGQFELLQVAAAQLVEVSSVDLLTTIATLLSPAGATVVQLRKANYQRLRGHASKVLDKAALPEHSEHLDATIVNARAAAAAIDGFTAGEVTLHCLVALHVDSIEAQAAARSCLSNAQVDAFLRYLSKWVDKYTNIMCDANPAFGAQQHLLPEALLFPRFTQVLDWIKAIVDGHLARLLMTRSSLPHIQKLQATLSMQVKCTEQLSMLRGAMDHMLARAPLPRAHLAAAQQYTVEVLDLSIRAQ